MISGLDGSLDLTQGNGIALGDDQGNGEFGSAAIYCLRFPGVHVAPAGVLAGDDLGRIVVSHNDVPHFQ